MSDEMTVYDENYPSRRLLDVIGDKWKPVVLSILGPGVKRIHHGEHDRKDGKDHQLQWSHGGCSAGSRLRPRPPHNIPTL